jgi:hypothetical protein
MPHTPGPWTAVSVTGSETEYAWIVGPDVVVDGVPRRNPVIDPEGDGGAVMNISPEDARLIAQAPEMYALLKELEWSQFVEGGGDTRCPVCKGDAYPVYKHEPDCRLAAVLKAVEGEDAP